MKIILLMTVASVLSGCAKEAPVNMIAVTSDTFCKLAKARDSNTFALTWSDEDTVETINGIETLAAKYNRVCLGRKKVAAIK